MAAPTASATRQAFRVFMGNIPWTIGSQELRQFASSFGAVSHASVIFDRSTGLSKGYGFVTFASRDGFNKATMGGAGSHILEGNHINIQPTTQD
jgi:RNA recognition motif-containing protein